MDGDSNGDMLANTGKDDTANFAEPSEKYSHSSASSETGVNVTSSEPQPAQKVNSSSSCHGLCENASSEEGVDGCNASVTLTEKEVPCTDSKQGEQHQREADTRDCPAPSETAEKLEQTTDNTKESNQSDDWAFAEAAPKSVEEKVCQTKESEKNDEWAFAEIDQKAPSENNDEWSFAEVEPKREEKGEYLEQNKPSKGKDGESVESTQAIEEQTKKNKQTECNKESTDKDFAKIDQKAEEAEKQSEVRGENDENSDWEIAEIKPTVEDENMQTKENKELKSAEVDLTSKEIENKHDTQETSDAKINNHEFAEVNSKTEEPKTEEKTPVDVRESEGSDDWTFAEAAPNSEKTPNSEEEKAGQTKESEKDGEWAFAEIGQKAPSENNDEWSFAEVEPNADEERKQPKVSEESMKNDEWEFAEVSPKPETEKVQNKQKEAKENGKLNCATVEPSAEEGTEKKEIAEKSTEKDEWTFAEAEPKAENGGTDDGWSFAEPELAKTDIESSNVADTEEVVPRQSIKASQQPSCNDGIDFRTEFPEPCKKESAAGSLSVISDSSILNANEKAFTDQTGTHNSDNECANSAYSPSVLDDESLETIHCIAGKLLCLLGYSGTSANLSTDEDASAFDCNATKSVKDGLTKSTSKQERILLLTQMLKKASELSERHLRQSTPQQRKDITNVSIARSDQVCDDAQKGCECEKNCSHSSEINVANASGKNDEKIVSNIGLVEQKIISQQQQNEPVPFEADFSSLNASAEDPSADFSAFNSVEAEAQLLIATAPNYDFLFK